MKPLFSFHEMNLITCIIQADIVGTGRLCDIIPDEDEHKKAAKERLDCLIGLRDKVCEVVTSGPLEENVSFEITRKQ